MEKNSLYCFFSSQSTYQGLLQQSDLIVGTEEEVMIAVNRLNCIPLYSIFVHLSQAPIVIKRGALGATVYFDDLDAPLICPYTSSKNIKCVRGGRCLHEWLVARLLRGENWQTSLYYANTCGGIVVTRHTAARRQCHILMKFQPQTRIRTLSMH